MGHAGGIARTSFVDVAVAFPPPRAAFPFESDFAFSKVEFEAETLAGSSLERRDRRFRDIGGQDGETAQAAPPLAASPDVCTTPARVSCRVGLVPRLLHLTLAGVVFIGADRNFERGNVKRNPTQTPHRSHRNPTSLYPIVIYGMKNFYTEPRNAV